MKKGGFGKNKPLLITIVALVVLAAMVLRDCIHCNAESLLLGVAVVSAGQQRKSHALAVVLCC